MLGKRLSTWPVSCYYMTPSGYVAISVKVKVNFLTNWSVPTNSLIYLSRGSRLYFFSQ